MHFWLKIIVSDTILEKNIHILLENSTDGVFYKKTFHLVNAWDRNCIPMCLRSKTSLQASDFAFFFKFGK